MPRTCSREKCGEEHYAKGLCHAHYRQSKRAAAMAARPAQGRRSCDVEGCTAFNYGHGLCRSHYYKQRRAAAAAARPAPPVATCTREGCDTRRYGQGLCERHYSRHYRHPELTIDAEDLVSRFPSLAWGVREWQLALTVRDDILSHLLVDMQRGSAS